MSWIKVRTELPTSVKILKLQRILGCSRMEAVGLAVSWFAWVDAHCDSEVTHLALPDFQELLCPANAGSVTTNAGSITANTGSVTTNAGSVTTNASSVTRDSIFMAFQSIGWIALDENGEVLVIDFEKHNGENAKRRAQNAKRVAKHKTNAGSVTTNASSITTNAGSVTKIEENAKPLTQEALPLTHDALPLTQVALPREDKIREDNNNISISLKETSNQSNYANNNTREETPNKPISVANKANSAQPCRIIEVFSYLETYFPAFTSEEHEQIANEFFVENSRSNWQNVTNWKLSLQRLIQSKYIKA